MYVLDISIVTSDMQGMMWGEPELVTWHCRLRMRWLVSL